MLKGENGFDNTSLHTSQSQEEKATTEILPYFKL